MPIRSEMSSNFELSHDVGNIKTFALKTQKLLFSDIAAYLFYFQNPFYSLKLK